VPFRSFRARLLVWFLGLFVLVQASAFALITAAHKRSARAEIDTELELAAGVFRQLVNHRTQRLVEAARLLAGDFAFKTAFATSDDDTILSALDNHRARINAAVMMLSTLDGWIVADTLHPGSPRRMSPYWSAIEAATDDEISEISSIVMLDDRPYQMVIVPLRAPLPVAWICIGFRLDDAFAAEFSKQTLSEVSLLERAASGGWAPFATTLPHDLAASLPEGLDAQTWRANASLSMRLGGKDYVTLVTPVGGETEHPVIAVLQRPLAEALLPYRRLQRTLLLLFAGGIALTVLVGVQIARSVARPVATLASSARKVAAGDYDHRVDVPQHDEIGELATAFNGMVAGLAERDRVRDLLGKVVSPEIAHELLSKSIELGGEEREVTILCSDLRNFTHLSESRSPQELVSLLNGYLTKMSAVVEAHAGVVDKYVGDAIVAIFGAPLSRADDSVRAVRTALGMVEALKDLNGELRRTGAPELASGIGINTGHVVAGNMGSPTRLNYTVIGDCVNLAARVEGLTKFYGVPILVTGSTKACAPSFAYREIDTVRVKGRTAPVTLYQPLGDATAVDAESLAAADQLHGVLADVRRRDWTSAHQRLTRLASASPTDRLYAYHLERIDGYLSQPPPADWDGVFTHPEK